MEILTLQRAPDLGIPEVKPAIESIRGRWFPKVSPKSVHSIVQSRLSVIFVQWAGDRGDVGSEWRYYFLPKGEAPSSLVPDLAYISYERFPLDIEREIREEPTIAPDIAVEILSPGDRKKLLREKIAMYVGFGTKLVVVVDPYKRTIVMHECGGVNSFVAPETARSAAYPDLTIDTVSLFRNL